MNLETSDMLRKLAIVSPVPVIGEKVVYRCLRNMDFTESEAQIRTGVVRAAFYVIYAQTTLGIYNIVF